VDFTETASEVVICFKSFRIKWPVSGTRQYILLIKPGNYFTSFATVSFYGENPKSTSAIS